MPHSHANNFVNTPDSIDLPFPGHLNGQLLLTPRLVKTTFLSNLPAPSTFPSEKDPSTRLVERDEAFVTIYLRISSYYYVITI